MVILRNLTKTFRRGSTETVIFKNVNLELDVKQKLAVLGARGAERRLSCICWRAWSDQRGAMSSGFRTYLSPVGYQRTYRPLLTCRENATFLARCYGADVQEVIRFVEEMLI